MACSLTPAKALESARIALIADEPRPVSETRNTPLHGKPAKPTLLAILDKMTQQEVQSLFEEAIRSPPT